MCHVFITLLTDLLEYMKSPPERWAKLKTAICITASKDFFMHENSAVGGFKGRIQQSQDIL